MISDAVEEHLVALLGDPATCPHGNPIPEAYAAPSRTELIALSDVETGDLVRAARISEGVEQDQPSLVFLEGVGFTPGATATVVEKQPDGTLMLEIGGALRAVGASLSQRLLVVRGLEAASREGCGLPDQAAGSGRSSR